MQLQHWGNASREIEIWKPAGVAFFGRETNTEKERKKKEERRRGEKRKRRRKRGTEEKIRGESKEVY